MAKLFDTQHLTEKTMKLLSANEASWVYNGLDCCVTSEVYNNLREQLDGEEPRVQETHKFAKAKLAPYMEMSLRGLHVDLAAKKRALRELKKTRDDLDRKFQRIMIEVFGGPLNWNSPTQVKQLLYTQMALKPVRKRNTKGFYMPTVNEEALEYLKIYIHARPIISFILTLRGIAKTISFLNTKLDIDNRIRTSFNLAGTVTGRLSSAESEFGSGCVLPSAEALTRSGWVRMDELEKYSEIAQWKDGIISFVPFTLHKEHTESMIGYKTTQGSNILTPGHRVLFDRQKPKGLLVDHAANVSKRGAVKIPVSGQHNGTISIPPIAAMLLADGSLEGKQWRVAFKKDRKKTRALQLMQPYSHTEQSSRPGYQRWGINGLEDLPTSWGPWVLNLTAESSEALVDEARHWDAHQRGRSFIFYSVDKKQAVWFQTLCHLTGRSTTLNSAINSDTAWGYNSRIYSVNVKPRNSIQVLRKHWFPVEYSGPVYCPSVPSSFWLVRHGTNISVTGNTNLQNVDRSIRYIFSPDPGMYMVNIDLEQADARNVGAIMWNMFYDKYGPEFAGSYLDACESADLHTTVCRMAWPDLQWPEDESKWKKYCSSVILYGQDSYRQIAKKLGHGTNYYGTPPTMARHTHTPVQIIKGFQRNYFHAFPVIPLWQDETISLIQDQGVLYNLFGRRRHFSGRGNDSKTHRDAIAYSPQSSTGEQIDRGLFQVWSTFDTKLVQFLVQVHDSILFQIPYAEAEELIPLILQKMQVVLELKGGRSFTIPLEVKAGWNWGDYDEDNPDKNPLGLKAWTGKEERERPSPRRRLKDYL